MQQSPSSGPETMDLGALIDEACSSHAVDCASLHRVLHLIAANIHIARSTASMDGRAAGQSKTNNPRPSRAPPGTTGGQANQRRELEVILGRLQCVQNMLQEIQRKVDKMEKSEARAKTGNQTSKGSKMSARVNNIGASALGGAAGCDEVQKMLLEGNTNDCLCVIKRRMRNAAHSLPSAKAKEIEMEEQNGEMLEALIDEAIGLPDGIINCTELNRLLKELVIRLTDNIKQFDLQRTDYEERLCAIEEAVALVQQRQEAVVQDQEHTEPMVTSEEEEQGLVPSSVASIQEEKVSLTFSQSQVSLKEQPEQLSTTLVTFMKELQERIQHVEQLFSAKLDSLANDFTQFQQTLNQGKQLEQADEVTMATTTPQQPPITPSTEQLNKLAEFSGQIEDLQRELEQLKGERDRLPEQIESLVQDKLKQCQVMAGEKKKTVKSSAPAYTEASSSRTGTLTTKTISASCTTQELLQNLNCLSCDTKNVIQRMRNGGRYLPPRSSAKLALAARRLGCSDSDVRQQTPTNVVVGRSRTCGGAYTVVQPDERVFRTVSGQIRSDESVPGAVEEATIEQEQWWCHFDDDNYVNVPRLVRMLDDYSPTQDWYLGKPSISSPLEIFLDSTTQPRDSLASRKHSVESVAVVEAGILLMLNLGLALTPNNGIYGKLCHNYASHVCQYAGALGTCTDSLRSSTATSKSRDLPGNPSKNQANPGHPDVRHLNTCHDLYSAPNTNVRREWNKMYAIAILFRESREKLELQTKSSTEVNKKVTFWFATGGAGFCISRALALKMMPIAASGKFVAIGDKIRFPDDVTMGFLIEHILKVPLTVIDAFHSHLEPMEFIRPETFHDQVSFSYARMRNEWNVVKVDGFDLKTDPQRIYSLHCYLYPFFSICPKSIRRR
ncbi:hypothetical protein AND_005235 [Anopheles darlingi]|uniref:Fringe-like glycosyltransferase domain-containing protein n=1 Tax=Anopheles darlingi TaxID=43151 RepID=W5JJI8_ANODA|nr:hypothetical protein AND_005235 [Anopheles darlingi]